MSDIVERLRDITPDVCGKSYWWAKNVKEAADKIERLRIEFTHAARTCEMLQADNERLRGALQSIASNACCGHCQEAALVARAALGADQPPDAKPGHDDPPCQFCGGPLNSEGHRDWCPTQPDELDRARAAADESRAAISKPTENTP